MCIPQLCIALVCFTNAIICSAATNFNYLKKAKTYINTDLDSAYYYANKAVEHYHEFHNDSCEIESLIFKHKLAYFKGMPDTAKFLIQNLYNKLNLLKDTSHKRYFHAQITGLEGGLYMDAGKYNKADSCYTTITQLIKNGEYTNILMMAKLNLGIVKKNQGNLYDSFLNYKDALRLSELVADYDMQFSILNMIAQILIQVDEADKGIEYLKQAGHLKDSVLYIGYIAEWHANMGYALYTKRKYSKSIEFYNRSLQIALKNKLPFYEALAKTNIGEIYLDLAELDKAYININEGLNLFDKLKSMYGKFYAISLMGGYYFQKEEYSKAKNYFHKANDMINDIEIIPELKKRHYQRQYKLYKKIKKLELALNSYEQYQLAKNDIINTEVKWKVQKLERNLHLAEKEKQVQNQAQEIQKKEYEIKLYKSRNWLLISLSFILVSLFAYLIIYMRLKRIKDKAVYKAELDKIITGYQLRSIQNQLSPHFIFNALNNFWNFFKQEDKQRAHSFLNRLSKLLQSTLEHADNSTITLQEEMDFVINYLELESICCQQKFKYNINISNNVNCQFKVLPMCIQTHVENALKHGIKPKKSSGRIEVNVEAQNNNIVVTVEDDGIGRLQSQNLKIPSTGVGLKTQQQMIELFNARNPEKMNMEIIDLLDPHKSVFGTKVILRIPLHYSYSVN
nr:histidine kinase [uncultured Carboxylicivirga sp.]